MYGLGNLTLSEMEIIGMVLEGFFYGLYSAIFFMYIQYQTSKELGIDKRNALFYALCILYILSVATVVIDISGFMLDGRNMDPSSPKFLSLQLLHLHYVATTINGLCDFISQAILIYRCWVIWGHNIRIIIIPSILALIFLAIWLAYNGSVYIVTADTPRVVAMTDWGTAINVTSLAMSLTVNAVVTGLIVLRILKLARELVPTFGDRTLGIGGAEAKVRSIIFIMIESGMAMFAIQLIRVVLTILSVDAVKLIIGINQMFNGITPTLILLRVSMGLSYHDQKSFVETAASWRFAPQNQDPVSETGGIEMAGQERLDRVCVQQHDDIEIVDRLPS